MECQTLFDEDFFFNESAEQAILMAGSEFLEPFLVSLAIGGGISNSCKKVPGFQWFPDVSAPPYLA